MIHKVRAWFKAKALLQSRCVSIKPFPFNEDECEDSESIDASDGVVVNGEIAVVQNNWGHKPGQIAFVVFEKDDGWSRVSNHDVEWRGTKRETKTPEELEVAYTKALHETLIEVVSMLLKRDCPS